MAYRLPPLNRLRLFESAGRTLSFKEAAKELGITASAVSHGVQSLEEWLGVPLFARGSRGLALTAAGSDYLVAVREALTLLATSSDGLPNRAVRSTLSISACPTFGSRLLLPRLARFRKLHPSIAIRLDSSHRHVEFPRDGFDLAIRLGDGSWPGLEAIELVRESLVPVCAPDLRARHGSASDLCDAPLIHVTTVTQDWTAWAAAAGRGPVDCRRGLLVDTIQMSIDAAVRGIGIAIGRRPFVDPELSNGSLVEFCGPTVRCATSYWLVGRSETFRRNEVAIFREWLLAEMQQISPDDAGGAMQSGTSVELHVMGKSEIGQRPDERL